MHDDNDDLWWLPTEYSIYHAALLIAGYNPIDADEYEFRQLSTKFPKYPFVRKMVVNAIETGRLSVTKLVHEQDDFNNRNEQDIDVYRTLISIESLDAWTRSRGKAFDVFNPNRQVDSSAQIGTGKYLSKKLVAANKAWTAVTSNPALLIRMSPKQALQKWLIEHAAELGLLTREGKLNQTGIDEICKVANWKPEGGATPTQSLSDPQSTVPIPRSRPSAPKGFGQKESFDLDDEIPF